ncbi:MAG: hypothetical protein ACT4P3_13625 [Betaproteobacteria bacterium]
MNPVRALRGAVAVSLLSGCANMPAPSVDLEALYKKPLEMLGNVLSTREERLQKALDRKQPEEAVRLWAENRDYFTSNAEKHRGLLARLGDEVNGHHEARMQAAQAALGAYSVTPAAPAAWPAQRGSLAEARSALEAYEAVPIAADPRLRSPRAAELQQVAAAVAGLHERAAPAAFSAYDHFGADRAFSDTYPVELSADALAAGFEALKEKLQAASSEQLATFRQAYVARLAPQQRKELSVIATRARFRELAPTGEVTLDMALELMAELAAARIDPDGLPLRLALLWLHDGAEGGDFPVSAAPGSGVSATALGMQALPAQLARLDFALIVDAQRGLAVRSVRNQRHERSTYKASERVVANPEYAEAVEALRRQEQEHQQLRNKNDQLQSQAKSNVTMGGIAGLTGVLGSALGHGVMWQAESNLRAAQNLVESTPRTIREDVMVDYRYTVSEMEVTRTAPAVIYLADVRAGRYLKRTVDRAESRRFETAEALDSRDPERDRIARRHASPESVRSYAATPEALPLPALVDAMRAPGASSSGSLASLSADIARERERTRHAHQQQKARAEQLDAQRANRAAAAAPAGANPVMAPAAAAPATLSAAAQRCLMDFRRAKAELMRVAQTSNMYAHLMGPLGSESDEMPKGADCTAPVSASLNQRSAQEENARVNICGVMTINCAMREVRNGADCIQARESCMARHPIPRPQ